MPKLQITLTEEQYQHIQEEINYSNRIHLPEGVLRKKSTPKRTTKTISKIQNKKSFI